MQLILTIIAGVITYIVCANAFHWFWLKTWLASFLVSGIVFLLSTHAAGESTTTLGPTVIGTRGGQGGAQKLPHSSVSKSSSPSFLASVRHLFVGVPISSINPQFGGSLNQNTNQPRESFKQMLSRMRSSSGIESEIARLYDEAEKVSGEARREANRVNSAVYVSVAEKQQGIVHSEAIETIIKQRKWDEAKDVLQHLISVCEEIKERSTDYDQSIPGDGNKAQRVVKMRESYAVLGLQSFADDEDVEKKYKELKVQLHPDKNRGSKDAEEAFKCLQDAYEFIKKNKSPG